MQQLNNEKATQETILSIDRLTDDLFIFRTTRPPQYSFVPGQYSRLGLVDNDATIWRPYSITSAPQDDYLEYYGVLVPGGAFTSLLNKIEPGAPIWLEKQLYGFMTVDRFVDGEDLWLLATGTGVGPFISILRDPVVWGKFRHIVLAHGVKHVDDLGFRDVLSELQAKPASDAVPRADLRVVEAITRAEGLTPDQLRGRLTTLLENGKLERQADLTMQAANSRVMMCGNPAMIEDMRRILHTREMLPCRRVLPGQFVTENYW